MSSISLLRLQNEESMLLNPFSIKSLFPSNIIPPTPFITSEGKNYFLWSCTILGRSNTIWAGGRYKIMLSFTEDYPFIPPRVFFDKNFKHVHVYEDGEICLGMLNFRTGKGWVKSYGVVEIVKAVEELIHGEPRVESPANREMAKLYEMNREEYEEVVRRQAKELSE